MFNEIEALALELKRLVGHGASPSRVVTYPTLRGLVAAKHPELTIGGLRLAILKELKQFSTTIADPDGEVMRELLILERRFNSKAPVRREHAIVKLGKKCMVDTWRREHELNFMREIAEGFIAYLSKDLALV